MRAVGVWRIIPRIRTGLKPLDHQPSTRLVPIVPLHQASLRLHNLPLSAVEEIPGTSAKTHKTRTLETFENLSNLSTAKYCNNQRYLDQLASWWTQEAARLRQPQGRHGMPGFRSCDCVCLRVSCTVSMFEKIVQCLDERGFIVKGGTLSILF